MCVCVCMFYCYCCCLLLMLLPLLQGWQACKWVHVYISVATLAQGDQTLRDHDLAGVMGSRSSWAGSQWTVATLAALRPLDFLMSDCCAGVPALSVQLSLTYVFKNGVLEWEPSFSLVRHRLVMGAMNRTEEAGYVTPPELRWV